MKKNGWKPFLLMLAMFLILFLVAGCGGGGGSGPVADPPTLMAISGDVQVGNGGNWQPVSGNVVMVADGSVKTGADGQALFTYKDGSTVEFEPASEATLTKGDGGNIKLASGSAWVASSETAIKVDGGGPVATVARAAAFSIKKNGANVAVKAVGGDIKFAAGGTEVAVKNGQSSASSGGAPSAPVATPFQGALRIKVEGEALLYLADPSSRALGYHPTGEMVTNQIPGSWYSGKAGRPQVISLLDPVPGKYTILLVAAGNQSAWKLSVGVAGPDLKYTETAKSSMITWGTPTGMWMNVDVDKKGVTSILDVSDIWTLYVDPPGKVALGETLKRVTIKTGQEPAWVQVGVKESGGGLAK